MRAFAAAAVLAASVAIAPPASAATTECTRTYNTQANCRIPFAGFPITVYASWDPIEPADANDIHAEVLLVVANIGQAIDVECEAKGTGRLECSNAFGPDGPSFSEQPWGAQLAVECWAHNHLAKATTSKPGTLRCTSG